MGTQGKWNVSFNFETVGYVNYPLGRKRSLKNKKSSEEKNWKGKASSDKEQMCHSPPVDRIALQYVGFLLRVAVSETLVTLLRISTMELHIFCQFLLPVSFCNEKNCRSYLMFVGKCFQC